MIITPAATAITNPETITIGIAFLFFVDALSLSSEAVVISAVILSSPVGSAKVVESVGDAVVGSGLFVV